MCENFQIYSNKRNTKSYKLQRNSILVVYASNMITRIKNLILGTRKLVAVD